MDADRTGWQPGPNGTETLSALGVEQYRGLRVAYLARCAREQLQVSVRRWFSEDWWPIFRQVQEEGSLEPLLQRLPELRVGVSENDMVLGLLEDETHSWAPVPQKLLQRQIWCPSPNNYTDLTTIIWGVVLQIVEDLDGIDGVPHNEEQMQHRVLFQHQNETPQESSPQLIETEPLKVPPMGGNPKVEEEIAAALIVPTISRPVDFDRPPMPHTLTVPTSAMAPSAKATPPTPPGAKVSDTGTGLRGEGVHAEDGAEIKAELSPPATHDAKTETLVIDDDGAPEGGSAANIAVDASAPVTTTADPKGEEELTPTGTGAVADRADETTGDSPAENESVGTTDPA
eukprot:GHVU01183273.1.p1 GENE.GHVU01183273.1~~GHVU01183273.1.p1  ORF type:complete len:343 (-),score=42.08 GHVU01183273.1:818-1846(-)